MNLIELTDEQRDELCNNVCEDFHKAQEAKGALPNRWKRNRELYECVEYADGLTPFEGAVCRHAPLTTPIIDTLVGNVCTPITTNSPYFMGKLHGEAGASTTDIEKTVQFFLELANFDSKVRISARQAALYNKSIIRIDYVELANDNFTEALDVQVSLGARSYAGLKIDIIEPEDFFICPETPEGIPGSKICGHIFYRRIEEIKQLAKDEVYYKDLKVTGDFPREEPGGSIRGENSLNLPGDETVKLATCFYKTKLEGDEREMWYNITVAPEQRCLLMVQKAIMPRPNYFSAEFQKDPLRFWSNSSVAQNLQGLQLLYNDLNNLVYNGAAISAYPTFTGSSMGMGPEKVVTVQPFGFLDTDSTTPISPILPQFNSSTLQFAIANVRADAERVARISSAVMGVAQQGRRTATEAAHIQAGSVGGLNEYLQTFCMGWADAIAFAQIVLAANYQGKDSLGFPTGGWSAVYGKSLTIEDPNLLLAPVRWEVNGRSPTNTPQGRITQGQMFAEMSMNPAAAPYVNIVEIMRSISSQLELPNADKFVKTDQEIQVMEQQMMQMQAQEAAKANGTSTPPPMGEPADGGGNQEAGMDGVLSGQALATRSTPLGAEEQGVGM